MHSETLKASDTYSADKATHPRVSLGDMQLWPLEGYALREKLAA